MAAFVAVDKDGDECIFSCAPHRLIDYWDTDFEKIYLSKGSIEKLIGRTLEWSNNPVELKDHN